MLRVVDVLPGKAEMEALGLVKKNFRIHPEVYRHYVAKFRGDFSEFARKYHESDHTAGGTAAATLPEENPAATDDACLTAFERSLPRFQYHRGGIYRYRIDRNGDTERPIILDSFERDELTGPPGIDGYTSEHSLFMLLVRRIEKWLVRQEKC
jgi:hypothetical protein